MKHKVMIIVCDGWGYGRNYKGNAVYKANTPYHDIYKKTYPSCILKCTGNDVGNPAGVQGGSEVGHLTIGAGRIVWQPYELINKAIKSGSFYRNKVLIDAIKHCKKHNSALHISGLFSDQGVHADRKHMYAVLELCKRLRFSDVFIHLCLDGRDMPERSALGLVKELNKKMSVGKIASVFGRYYGMDRDKNWNRTRKAYDLLVEGKGFKVKTSKHAIEKGIKSAYKRGDRTDYYIHPMVIVDEKDKPVGLLKDNDSFIWYNYRSDRSRQITSMINDLSYCTEKKHKKINVNYVCFTSYDDRWKLPVAFVQEKVKNNLGKVVADKGLKQLRIAETEKYAHVTFFFNSQIDKANKGEKRIMIPSPKVISYDLKPEMSAYKVTKKVIPEIGKYDLIVLNYANPDLVGHSGVFKAVVKACEVVDDCVGRVVKKALDKDYAVFLMADHGNAEHMLYDNGEIDPSHGFDPVRLILISNEELVLKDGGLKDIAPSVLKIMGIKKPKEMNGKSLV